jgi:drug/metabolite transporter (DMT)-like permease
VPTLLDWIVMSGLGLVWAGGMYCMARAYSLAQASVVAPFEYVSLPINIMWGLVIWQEIPTLMTLAGAFLTLFSELYILYRERK